MKKHLIKKFIAVVLLIGVLVGCSSNGNGDSGKKVVIDIFNIKVEDLVSSLL